VELKEIRNKNKISQQKACSFLRVPLRTYKRYENDVSYKSSYKYFLFCNALEKYQIEAKKKIIKSLNITIAGAGYVGLSLACLLSNNNKVVVTDIDSNKIININNGIVPFKDELIKNYLIRKKIIAEKSQKNVYLESDVVIIATPTNFNKETNQFDTHSIEDVINMILSVNKEAIIVIKSTIPLGYTRYLINKFHYSHIVFSPEFLREGKALYDNLHPSRIIAGYEKSKKDAVMVINLLKNNSLNSNVSTLLMKSEEAEAVKLFSNAFLAMRVSFFNELDTYAETRNIDSNQIIKGVSLDSRIGNFYNNPSFGYGGYCLPKDTAQLANSFLDIPNNNLIRAIVNSNETRKEFIANQIIKKVLSISNKPIEKLVIGVYLLSMKNNSDNFRSSSTIDIIQKLKNKGTKIIIYDPNYASSEKNFDKFINECDYYIANRYEKKLKNIKNKLYTRDLFNRD